MPVSSSRSPAAPSPSDARMNPFDCNVTVGRRSARNIGSPHSVQGLVSTMECYGIRRALVSHAICEDSGPVPGNDILLSQIKGHEGFTPCWVLLPNHTGEIGDDPRALVQRMIENGVKAAKVYPVKHYFSLSEWCAGAMLSELERHKIPLLVDFSIVHYSDAVQNIPWGEIHEACRNHRDLPLVLLRVGSNANRNLFPLLDTFENLHIDISYYAVNNGIELICDRFGADHLVFGTGLPVFSPAGPVCMLAYSDISPKARRAIASENLERILGRSSHAKQ